jgi:hypothetical protein
MGLTDINISYILTFSADIVLAPFAKKIRLSGDLGNASTK